MPVSEISPRGSISAQFTVTAQPASNGSFYGAYSMPGRDWQRVIRRKPDGAIVPIRFDNEALAKAAAGEALCDAMNHRVRGRNSHGYRRIGGAELAVRLAELQLSPAAFARIVGWDQAKVMRWIDGEENVPHVVRIALEMMLETPGALQVAVETTEQAMQEAAAAESQKEIAR